MNSPNSLENEFLTKLTEIVEANINNPQFGVSVLAREMGMSRSNLHRKVNEITKITVSQFINQVRLKKAKEILRHTTNTVSEVAYEVGFNNVSYFIKCFHKYYGYSPGEIGNREDDKNKPISSSSNKIKRVKVLIPAIIIGLLLIVFYFIVYPFRRENQNIEKTIAVIPMIYLNPDSASSVADGIAFAVNNKLELIEDLTVRPWISVRKFRDPNKDVYEISKDLNVNYLVQFVCQNYGQKDFSITVTLINAWNNTMSTINKYESTIYDIYAMEDNISKEVAEIIDAKITPKEKLRINRRPTDNDKALRYYYQGLQKQNTDAKIAVSFFKKAVEEDSKFALAYAELANAYNLLDTGINNGKYTSIIAYFAEQAILYDNENDKCLITKARILSNQGDFESAIHYLEKAVEYNPNSAVAYRFLAKMSSFEGIANQEKCVEYALKAINYNQLEEDPVLKSGDYHYLARAFRQAGLFTEARKSIDSSIKLQPDGNGFITEIIELIIDSSGNYNQAIELLKERMEKTPAHEGINSILFKVYYYNRDFQNAYRLSNLISNLPPMPKYKEVSRLAVIYNHIGMLDKSDSCIVLCENLINTERKAKFLKIDHLMRLYCLKKDTKNAIEQFREFNQFKYLTYDYFRLFKDEPVYDPLRLHPEFQKILSDMETKIIKQKEQIRKSMVAKGLM